MPPRVIVIRVCDLQLLSSIPESKECVVVGGMDSEPGLLAHPASLFAFALYSPCLYLYQNRKSV